MHAPRVPGPKALFLDFNGTLSDDQEILWQVYASLLADAGRALSEGRYHAELAGLSDEQVFRRELGPDADVRHTSTTLRPRSENHAVCEARPGGGSSSNRVNAFIASSSLAASPSGILETTTVSTFRSPLPRVSVVPDGVSSLGGHAGLRGVSVSVTWW
jgi:hypothetical protein